jgi:heterodisulfide reductase subunit A
MPHNHQKKVTIVGGGPAGMQAAVSLAQFGVKVEILEKQSQIGGHLLKWSHLFPDVRPSEDILNPLKLGLNHSNIEFSVGKQISSLQKNKGKWTIQAKDGFSTDSDAVILATGFSTFNAKQKEEYGYGVYSAVVTSEALESIFKGESAWPINIHEKDLRFGIVHCVGSRDAKCGNLYCSKVCCITAVKQAIELKKLFPTSTVYCFYMDMRMFGVGYEELYHEAQTKYNVQFIRGRLSEASPAEKNRIQVKAEDTLLGRPVKVTLDMLVLMVGMTPSNQVVFDETAVQLKEPEFGTPFIKPNDVFLKMNSGDQTGLFFTGACKGPASIPEVLQDAKAAALEVIKYLNFS